MRHGFFLMLVLLTQGFMGCQGAQQLQTPSIPRSQSEVTTFGTLRFSADVSQSGACEIVSVFCDYVMLRALPVTGDPGPAGPEYGSGGELIDPVVGVAGYDADARSVSYTLSTAEMEFLGDRLIVYRWVIEYRLPGGTDIRTARSEIFQTSVEDADGENNLVIVL